MTKRKIVSYHYDAENDVITVVCNDETIWWLDAMQVWNKVRVPPIPQD